MPSAKTDRLLTPMEVSTVLGVSFSQVLAWIHQGDLKAYKIPAGKGWRYWMERSEIDRFLRDGSALPVSKGVATAASGEAGS